MSRSTDKNNGKGIWWVILAMVVISCSSSTPLPDPPSEEGPCCEQVQIMFRAFDELCDEIDPGRRGICHEDSLYERIKP